jgi:hypothetical protein
MASPVDTFKKGLFGQLKSYSNAVQGVFEQRIGKIIYKTKKTCCFRSIFLFGRFDFNNIIEFIG